MPINLVQARNVQALSLAFSSNVTSGNLIIVVYQSEGAVQANPTCTDTLGTTYTRIVNAGSPIVQTWFWGKAPSSGANTVTVAGVLQSFNHLAIHEFFESTGTLGFTAITAVASGTSTAPASAAVTPNSLTFSLFTSFASAPTVTVNPPLQLATNYNGSDGGATGYTLGVGTGSFTPTGTISSSTSWTAATATFTATSVGTITGNMPAGRIGVAFSQSLNAAFAYGGSGSYTWTLTSGTLPTGLSITGGNTLSGTPTVAGIYTYTLQVTDGSTTASESFTQVVGGGAKPYPCKLDPTNPLASKMVLLLPFNESAQWYMVNNVALSGDSTNEQSNPIWYPICGFTPVWSADPALVFPGGANTANYIDTLQQGVYGFEAAGMESTPWTMICDVYWNSISGSSQILFTKNTGGSGWTFFSTSTGALGFYFGRATSPMTTQTSGSAIAAGQWYQVACTYDGSQTPAGLKIYVNGVLQTPASTAAGSGAFTYNTSTYTRIGGGSDSIASFNGKMYYAAMYFGRALSAVELQQFDAALPIISTANPTGLPAQGWLNRYGWVATADSVWDSSQNYIPFHVLDGIVTYPSTNTSFFAISSWASANTAPPHYLILDMLTPQTFNTFSYWRRTDGLPNQMDLYVSSDGVTWNSPIYTNNSAPNAAQVTITFPTQTFRYIKFVGRQLYNNVGTANGQNDMVIAEVRVGYNPYLSDATTVPTITMPRNNVALPGQTYLTQTINTTLANPITGTGYQTVTPVSMTNIVANVNQPLMIGSGSTKEIVYPYTVTNTTFSAIFDYTHSAGEAVVGYTPQLKYLWVKPYGGNVTQGFPGQSLGDTLEGVTITSTIPGTNGFQRTYKLPSTGGGGGGGGGTNTSGVGQIFPTGYYF